MPVNGLFIKNTFLDCNSPWYDPVNLPPRPSSDPTSSATSTSTDPTELSAVVSTECPVFVTRASRRGQDPADAILHRHRPQMPSPEPAHGDAATGSADRARGPAGRAGAAEGEGEFVSRTKSQRRREHMKLSKAFAQQQGRQTPSPEHIHGAAATGAADSAGPEGRAGAAAEEKGDLRTKCQRFEQKKLLKESAHQRGETAATGSSNSSGDPEGRAGAAAAEVCDLRTKCHSVREQKKLLKESAQQRGADGPEKSRAEGVCDDAENSTKISL